MRMEENKVPQDVEQYQKHYSESGFWNKVGKLGKKYSNQQCYCIM